MKKKIAKLKTGFNLLRYLPLNFLFLKALRVWKRKLFCRSAEQTTVSLGQEKTLNDLLLVPALVLDRDMITKNLISSEAKELILTRAEAALEHKFDLLGSGPILVEADKESLQARYERMTCLMGYKGNGGEIPLSSYKPIDWHLDFKSGYRWNSQIPCQKIVINPGNGADIKVPWELSRMQHGPAIGLAALVDQEVAKWGDEFVLQVTDWIAANPYPYGVNWSCTMDVAIRAVNWLWSWALLEGQPELDEQFKIIFISSLHQHGQHIECNLEYIKRGYHGNHYLANLAGLIYIGALLPGFEESDRWLCFGLQELNEEMIYQVYEDGVSFEGSTAYHRLAAEIFYSCTALALKLPAERRRRLERCLAEEKPKVARKCRMPMIKPLRKEIFSELFYARLEKMADFSLAVTKPSGEAPQLGDNDSGRLHKFTPVIDKAGNEDVNDFRHLLALAGKMFRRDDFLEVGKDYLLDAEILLGGINYLPLVKQKNKPIQKVFNAKRTPVGKSLFQVAEIKLSLEGEVTFTNHEPDVVVFPKGGVAVYKSPLYYLAYFCTPNGLGGIGAHSHNDKLSFELSVGGVDFLVDGGSYLYTSDPGIRDRFRSTEAHNTLLLEDHEQNPLIEDFTFLLPDRTKAELLEISRNRFVGSHRGYGFEHRRELELGKKQIVIRDYLGGNKKACLTFNLHPAVRILSYERQGVVLSSGKSKIVLKGKGIKDISLQQGFYSLKYGVKIENKRLIIQLNNM